MATEIEKIRFYQMTDEATEIQDTDVAPLDNPTGFTKGKKYTFLTLWNYIKSKFIASDNGAAISSDYVFYYDGTTIKKCLISDLPVAGGDNFANTNLTLDANRTHNFGAFTTTFSNGALKIQAKGNTSIDYPLNVTESNGTTSIFEVRGNGIMTHGGLAYDNNYSFNINANKGVTGGLYITRSGGGVPLSINGGSYNQAQGASVAQWFGEGADTVGVWGRSTSGVGVKAETTGAGKALQTIGKINFNTLPTSATGLSAGDVWNDSGTLKIV